MRIVSSARMLVILGASLTTTIAPLNVLAADNGSGVSGIDGSASLGIDGSAILGIDGSAALGIDGSAGLGIDGSAGLGIDGSAGLGIDGSAGLGIDGSALMLTGPVSSVNVSEGLFTSMGQIVSAPNATLLTLSIGDYVFVDGRVSGAGTIDAYSVVQTGERYIAGASPVSVTGIPSSVDLSRGTATIGGLEVDYTSSMGRSDFRGIGAAVTAIGTQPALGGKMISSELQDKTELFLRD